MATLGLSKVFILDKYFTELQKFWETEKKLQGKRLSVIQHINITVEKTAEEIQLKIFLSHLLR